jgi:hypothetical protein
MCKGCLSGCLEGFIFSIIIIALVVIFSGGAVNMTVLFTAALIAIIINGLLSLAISIIKWIFK